ncbi:MAG TPA: LemA family protein [Armatimonadota bacterium]
MTGFILGVIIIIFGITAFVSFKQLAQARNSVDTAWHNEISEFERRREIIPSIIELLRLSDAATADKMAETLRTRLGNATATAIQDVTVHENEVSKEIRNLVIVTAGFPGVSGALEFHNLAQRLIESEDRIDSARKNYNNAVAAYNKTRSKWPMSVLASLLDYHREDFFEVEYATERTPSKA